jgi:NADP-dependent 3-hydroxy acid dehydrogenase YdfG
MSFLSVFIEVLEALLPEMLERKKGYMVAVSPTCRIPGFADTASYSSTKFAIRGTLKVMGSEWKWSMKSLVQTSVFFSQMYL